MLLSWTAVVSRIRPLPQGGRRRAAGAVSGRGPSPRGCPPRQLGLGHALPYFAVPPCYRNSLRRIRIEILDSLLFMQITGELTADYQAITGGLQRINRAASASPRSGD